MTTLSELTDAWTEADEERLEANRAAAAATTKAEVLKHLLMAELKQNELTASGGQFFVAELKPKDVPTVNDWQALYRYIVEHDAFDLLHKRLGEKAISLRWEDDIEIPGVAKTEILTLTKRKVKR